MDIGITLVEQRSLSNIVLKSMEKSPKLLQAQVKTWNLWQRQSQRTHLLRLGTLISILGYLLVIQKDMFCIICKDPIKANLDAFLLVIHYSLEVVENSFRGQDNRWSKTSNISDHCLRTLWFMMAMNIHLTTWSLELEWNLNTSSNISLIIRSANKGFQREGLVDQELWNRKS
jgi:hypothetical protein